MSAKNSIFKFADKFGYESPFGDWVRKLDEDREERKEVGFSRNVNPARPLPRSLPLGIHEDYRMIRSLLGKHQEQGEFCAILGFGDNERKSEVEKVYGGTKKFNDFLAKAMGFASLIYRTNGISFNAYYLSIPEYFFSYSVDGDYAGKMFMETDNLLITRDSDVTTDLLVVNKKGLSNKPLAFKQLGFFIAHEYFHQLLGRLGYVLYDNTNALSNTPGQHTNFEDYYNLNTEGGWKVNSFKMAFDKRFYRIWKPQLYLLENYSKYINPDLRKLGEDLFCYLKNDEKREREYRKRISKIIHEGVHLGNNGHRHWEVEKPHIPEVEMLEYLHKFSIDGEE